MSSSPSPHAKKKSKSRRANRDMDYKESQVSQTKRVQNAVREARKSSREKGKQRKHPPRTPTTPRGLVIQTSPEKTSLSRPQSLDMNSPSMSEINHMDQLLAPTYDSTLENGSSSIRSANTSDDIIRKVELEIATARKAATEAQSRLADALSKSWELKHKYSNLSESNHDPLDDLDIPLKDILSISSAEVSPTAGTKPNKAKEQVPTMALNATSKSGNENTPDGSNALKNIEAVVSHDSEEGSNTKTASTDPTDSPTGSSSNEFSPELRYNGTQQTFESGVELGLSDVEATLGNNPANLEVAVEDSDDGDDYASATPRSETLPDEYSDYTEETVTDEGEDDNSEYTEETVHSDEEEEGQTVDKVPSEPSSQSQGDEESSRSKGDDENEEESPDHVERPDVTSPKPWIVGSRDMHKSPKDAKPWWSGGWWPDQEGAPKPKSPNSGERPPGPDAKPDDVRQRTNKASYKEALALPKCDDKPDQAPTPSSRGSESRPSDTPTSEGASEASKATEAKEGSDEQNKQDNGETPVLRDLSINTCDANPAEETEAPNLKQEHKSNDSRVQFRHPYPVPPQVPKPRPAPDIIADNTTGAPKRVTRWSKPKPELNDLLAAVRGGSLPRRSNAVGALKILLSRDPKNLIVLVRTTGFLEALVFACSEDIEASPEMDTAINARSRAVTTIMKVSEPKENRVLVVTEPGLPEALVKVIKEDTAEARAHACAALAMLAKTPMNKEYIANVDDLINVLSLVVNGTIDPTMGPAGQQPEEDGARTFSFEEEATYDSSINQGSLAEQLFTSDSIRKQKDEKQTEFVLQAKINACAALMHLSKHCSISSMLAANLTFMDSMMAVSRDFESPLNTKCIEIVCNITRFHANTPAMARNDVLLETLLKCGKSKTVDDRVWALRSFQNIAADSSSKVILANSRILTLLSICAMRKGSEQEAAVAAMYNLSTEPSAVVPITNTRNVIATLVHLAHNPKVSDKVQRMSCEGLATVGLWLQTLAGSGSVPDEVSKSLLPTHKTVGWQRWA